MCVGVVVVDARVQDLCICSYVYACVGKCVRAHMRGGGVECVTTTMVPSHLTKMRLNYILFYLHFLRT